MKNLLSIYINNTCIAEYDRAQRYPGHQRDFLDKMDEDMDMGVQLEGEVVLEPTLGQRLQYVAMHLVRATQTQNKSMIDAMIAYLVKREPRLSEIRVEELGEDISLELIYDE